MDDGGALADALSGLPAFRVLDVIEAAEEVVIRLETTVVSDRRKPRSAITRFRVG